MMSQSLFALSFYPNKNNSCIALWMTSKLNGQMKVANVWMVY